MDAAIQAAILALGGCSVWLVGSVSPRARLWGCCLGLASQPFWLIAAARAGQWGVFVLACWYVVSWARGIRNAWREIE